MVVDGTIGWLEGLAGNVKGERLELRGDSFVIGRGATTEIKLEDPLVSREHARIEFRAGQLSLEDMNSTHGTFVNGEQIRTIVLQDGDRIRFGSSLFHLHLAKFIIDEIEASQDEIATMLVAEDKLAAEPESPDDIATVMAEEGAVPGSNEQAAPAEAGIRCVHCGARLTADEQYCGRCGKPGASDQPASRRAESLEFSSVTPVPPISAPAVGPPEAPAAFAASKRSGPPGWMLAAIGGTLAAVVLGAALILAINLIGGEPESPAESLVAVEITAETSVSMSATHATQTPAPEDQQEPSEETQTPQILGNPTSSQPDGQATQASSGAPTQDVESEAPVAEPVIGGAAGIAFASNRTGLPQIYYLDLNEETISQLTDIADGACQPAWSPDGTRLAFISPCGSNREAYIGARIFIMDVDQNGDPGSTQPLMVSLSTGDYDPDWSPDGSAIAFTSQRTGRPQIFTVGLQDQAPFNVNDDLAHNWSPSWSEDGSRIAFLTGRGGAEEIWLVGSGGGEEARFSRSDGQDVAKPDWSPDGSIILFEKVVGSIPRIFAAPVSEGGIREIQVCQEGTLSLQPMGEPAWSPDGEWLAFETWPGGVDHKIAIMQISCTGYQELTEDPALDFDAAWRP